MGRPGKYLFQPPGSSVWHVRFQYPESLTGEKKYTLTYNLKTRDKSLAEELKHKYIADHLKSVREMRERKSNLAPERRPAVAIQRIYEIGRSQLPDGRWIAVNAQDPKFAIVMNPDGSMDRLSNLREIPIEGPGLTHAEWEAGIATDTLLSPDPVTGMPLDVDCPGWRQTRSPRIRPQKIDKRHDADAEIITKWIEHRNVNAHIEAEAWDAFRKFKSINSDISFKSSSFEHGEKLVAFYFEQGLAYSTVRKKVGHLRSAINIAKRKKLFVGDNPFSCVLREPKAGDIKKRFPMSNATMASVRERAPSILNEWEWLLWVFLASTGVRLSEAVNVTDEFEEDGVRYVIIGHRTKAKTRQSVRRVPLPECLLPLLPPKINGSLWPGRTARALSQRMGRRLDDLGVTDPGMTMHCLRHRAIDKLRNDECPPQMIHELMGHEVSTVASGYGRGYPVRVLKKWIDKIGY